MTVHEILDEGMQEVSSKTKQDWKRLKPMFYRLETMLTVEEMKQLHGIRTLNEHTITFREERYEGEFTESVQWLCQLHPSLTHSETLAVTLEDAMSRLKLTEGLARIYQNKFLYFDPRTKQHYSDLKGPPFHISTETKDIKNNSFKNTKFLSIHISTRAELITTLMAEVCAK